MNDRGTVSISKNRNITYSEEDKVAKAEILKALKVLEALTTHSEVSIKTHWYTRKCLQIRKSQLLFLKKKQKWSTIFNMVLRLTLKSHWLRIFVIVYLLSNLMRQPLSMWKNNTMGMFSISQNIMAKSWQHAVVLCSSVTVTVQI